MEMKRFIIYGILLLFTAAAVLVNYGIIVNPCEMLRKDVKVDLLKRAKSQAALNPQERTRITLSTILEVSSIYNLIEFMRPYHCAVRLVQWRRHGEIRMPKAAPRTQTPSPEM